jgi:hypothetical protein
MIKRLNKNPKINSKGNAARFNRRLVALLERSKRLCSWYEGANSFVARIGILYLQAYALGLTKVKLTAKIQPALQPSPSWRRIFLPQGIPTQALHSRES